jgi:hypothetical protein
MLSIALLATWLAGCALIVHGTTQQVRIETIPAGAKASVGSQTITTPGELTLPREYSFIVNLEKPGCVPTYAHVESETSNLVWGNILLGGFAGAAIDFSSGAAYNLQPATVFATLPSNPAAEPPYPSPAKSGEHQLTPSGRESPSSPDGTAHTSMERSLN